MGDDKLAIEEARRAAQHESVKSQVEGEVNAEISDRSNGGANGAATTQSYPARGTVPCTATGDPTVGSTCSLSSTLDAMIGAGAVVEKKRAVWELGETKVLDAGADGVATTVGDNTTFAVSGLFFP